MNIVWKEHHKADKSDKKYDPAVSESVTLPKPLISFVNGIRSKNFEARPWWEADEVHIHTYL